MGRINKGANSMSNMISGKVAFSNLTEHDIYKGKSTGKYALTVTLDDPSAKGVKLKDYNDTQQKKFTSKYRTEALAMDGSPYVGEIPRGSKVRVLYALGQDGGEHGVGVYMNKIRVVEEAEQVVEVPDEF
jgi:hypothetical protein